MKHPSISSNKKLSTKNVVFVCVLKYQVQGRIELGILILFSLSTSGSCIFSLLDFSFISVFMSEASCELDIGLNNLVTETVL